MDQGRHVGAHVGKLEESAYPLTAFQLAIRTHLSGSTVSDSRWSVKT